MSDAEIAWISKKVEASRRLADEFAKQGLHVGFGSPPICVTCGCAWPCADSEPDKLDTPCEADGP